MGEDYDASVAVVGVGLWRGARVAGGVSLLTETARVSGLESQLRRALELQARRRVVHDPAG